MWIKTLCFQIFLFFFLGSALAEEPAKPTVSVKVMPLTEQPTAGGALDVVLIVKNESQEQIRISTSRTLADYAVTAFYKDGSPVPPSAYVKWLSEQPGGGLGGHMLSQKVEPGERFIMLVRVSEVIDISKEDEYSLKIFLKNVCSKAGKEIPAVAVEKINLPQKSFALNTPEMKRAREMAQQDGPGRIVGPVGVVVQIEPAPNQGEKKK